MQAPSIASTPSVLARIILVIALVAATVGIAFVAAVSDEIGDSGCGGG